ncbi:MAG: tRNA (N(6)-L-threonylcarbamoyladenosine(37)-C(2))-methylthiotransferase [Thermoplasmata archaeon]
MRVYVESYGCSQNQGEGAAIARQLATHGHGIARAPQDADVAVLVTCGVIGATEARMLRRWEELGRRTPRLVVTGCLVPLRTEQFQGPARERTTFVAIPQQGDLPLLLGPGSASPPEPPSTLAPPPSLVEEVAIAQGCTSGCSYCFSRLARGRIESVPPTEVVARLRSALARGARELRLTALDTAAWGEDLPGGPGLPDLLRTVAGQDGDFRLRVGMMSPQSLGPRLDDYLSALSDPRVYRFLHLPVQSGSDRILGAMRRGYDVAEFRRQVAAARHRFPELHLSTDVIVGFPGETEEDHRATEALIAETAPETVNVTRFSARPGTVAARLRPVGPRIAKRRSRSLTELRQRTARERLERWIGRAGRARVLEYGPRGSAVARLDNYLPVVLPERPPLGADVEVRIDGARSTYLLGRLRDPGV